MNLKKIAFILLLGCCFRPAFAQLSYNTMLVGHWSNDNLPALQSPAAQRFNELWGYYDSAKSREYIIMGSIDSIYFFDVTNPAAIKVCDVEAGRSDSCINRDFQTYSHYAYAVNDQYAGSLQVFDLQYLPDSVHKVYDSDSLGMTTHTICVYKDLLFMCSNTDVHKVHHPIRIASLANPENPAFVATFDAPVIGGNKLFSNVHDMTVVDDTAYLSCGDDGLFIFDVKNPQSPKYVYSLNIYPEKGYNHNSWLTPDKKHIVFTDENLGLGVKLYEIQNPNTYKLQSIMRSHIGAIAHNPFIVGNSKLYLSYYHDGVYMFDISDPVNPVILAYYDTYPENSGYAGYAGCWGVYPFMPSGTIFASDMSHGLFALRMNNTGLNSSLKKGTAEVYPNPSGESASLKLFSPVAEEATVSIIDNEGRVVSLITTRLEQGQNSVSLTLGELTSGIYYIHVISNHGEYSSKLVKN
jgi:choice-of-anchor B domain-containing protein